MYTLVMVLETVLCAHCGSANLRRDGKAPNGKQKYFCHDCQKGSRQNPAARAYSAEFQAQVLAAYHERCSQRGVCRIFGIARQTLADWLKKSRAVATLEEDARQSPEGRAAGT